MSKLMNISNNNNKLKVIVSNGDSIYIKKPSVMSFLILAEKVVEDKIFNLEIFKKLIVESNDEIDFLKFTEEDFEIIATCLITYMDTTYEITSFPISDFFIILQVYIGNKKHEVSESFRPLATKLNDLSKKTAETIEPIARNLIASNNRIAEMIQPMADNFAKTFISSITPYFESISKQSEDIANSMSIMLGKFAKKANEYAISISNDELIVDRAEQIFSKYDLFFCDETNFDVDDCKKIIEIDNELEEEEKRLVYEKMFIDAHDDDIVEKILNRVINEIKLIKRKKIIEEIHYGYSMNKYFLTVPVLLAQIEGIIAELKNHNGFMGKTTLEVYVEELFQKDYREIVKKIYLNKVIGDSFKHGDIVGNPLNRNSIMHGGNFVYGTRITCLKLILILDLAVSELKKLDK